MALQTYNMDVTFVEGQDTRSDSKNVTVSKPLALKNVRFERTGALTTRPGYAVLNTGTNYIGGLTADGVGILFKQGLIEKITDTGVSSTIGAGYPAFVRKQVLGDYTSVAGSGLRAYDAAFSGDKLIVAWARNNPLVDPTSTERYLVIQISKILDRFGSQSVLQTLYVTSVGTLANVRVVPVSSTYALVLYHATSGGLQGRVINLNSLSLTSISFPVSLNAGSSPRLQAELISTSGTVANIGVSVLGASDLVLAHCAITLTTGSVSASTTVVDAAIAATSARIALAVSTSGGTSRLNLIWYSGTIPGTRARSYSADSSLTSVWGPTSISTPLSLPEWVGISQINSSSHALCSAMCKNLTSSGSMNQIQVDDLSAVGVQTPRYSTRYFGAALRGRLLSIDDQPFACYVTDTAPSGAVGEIGLVNLSTTYGPTKIASWDSVALPSVNASISYSSTLDKYIAIYASSVEPINIQAGSTSAAGQQAYITTANYRSSPATAYIDLKGQSPKAVRVNTHTLISAGTWLTYDDDAVRPSYFCSGGGIEGSFTAGGSLGTGVYQTTYVVDWLDNRGNRHTSAPAHFKLIQTQSGGTNVYQITSDLRGAFRPGWFPITNGPSPATLTWYTSELNGSILYQSTIDASVYYTYDLSTWPSGTKSLTAGTTATGILYTTGGILENDSLPSPRYLTEYKGRAAALTAGWDNRIFISKPAEPGIAIEWSLALYVDAPAKGGITLGLQQMDGTLYIFKRNQILTLYGDPPGATGEGGSLNTPQVVYDGVGVSDPESIVLTPKGIMFKSDKGFYLILRNQELAYIGEGPFNQTGTVYSAAADLQRQEVFFTLSTGVVLVYNYYQNAWSYYVLPWTPVAGGGLLKGDRHYVVTTTGSAYLPSSEDTATYVDGTSTAIMTDISTGWIRMNGIGAFQRIKKAYFVGDWTSSSAASATITVKVYTDYSDTPVQTRTIPVSGMGSNKIEFELRMSVQKCESLRFDIEQDQGRLDISGITLELGVKPGNNKSRNGAGNY